MAGSIESNGAIYKKQAYKYIAPAPPSELLDSSVFVIDFTNRKFVHVGFDSRDNFNIAIHIITSSRFINIESQFLKRIYSLTSNILSFILDPPQKWPLSIFLEDETVNLSKTLYRGQNYLVLNSKTQEGCRVLLNRDDLVVLQNLERIIFDSIVRKTTFTRPNMLYQFQQAVNLLVSKDGINTIVNVKDMKTYISHIPDQEIAIFIPENLPSYIGQFKLYSLEQLAVQTLSKRKTKLEFMLCDIENVILCHSPQTPPDSSYQPENENEPINRQPMSYDTVYESSCHPHQSPQRLSTPTLDENNSLSFYDLIHVPSPPVSPIKFPEYHPKPSRTIED